MNFGEWQARLYENPGTLYIDLWLSRITSHGREVITHKGTLVTLKEGEATNQDNYFARFEGYEQINAIAEAFAKFGIQTSSDAKNQGLLEAKEQHLQDMRKLVFENKYNTEETQDAI